MRKRWIVGIVAVVILVGGVWWTLFAGDAAPPMAVSPAVEAERASQIQSTSKNSAPARPSVLQVTKSEGLIDGFPESFTIHEGDKEYVVRYTGRYMYKKRVPIVPVEIDLYWVASYVESPHEGDGPTLLDDLMQEGPRKLYMLRFVRWLKGSWMTDSMQEGIQRDFVDVDLVRLKKNLDFFVGQFSPGSNDGDEVYIVWLPVGRTYSGFRTMDNVQLVAEDAPLARAIWRIWAGPNRAPQNLRLVERYATESSMRR